MVNGNNIVFNIYSSSEYSGLIAGVCSGSIQGCKVSGKITFAASDSDYSYAGGICKNLYLVGTGCSWTCCCKWDSDNSQMR